MEQYKNECASESKMDLSLHDNLIKFGDFSEDRSFQCYLKCQIGKKGFINENDDFNIELMVKNVPGATHQLYLDCYKKVIDMVDLCEKTYFMSTCLGQEIEKNVNSNV